MLFLLVLFGWLAAAGYIPFHFRKTLEAREFIAGFKAVWWSLLTAEIHQPEDFVDTADPMQSKTAGGGILTAFLSLIALAVAVVGLAIYTLIWAW
jgi:hypothetical protein